LPCSEFGVALGGVGVAVVPLGSMPLPCSDFILAGCKPGDGLPSSQSRANHSKAFSIQSGGAVQDSQPAAWAGAPRSRMAARARAAAVVRMRCGLISLSLLAADRPAPPWRHGPRPQQSCRCKTSSLARAEGLRAGAERALPPSRCQGRSGPGLGSPSNREATVRSGAPETADQPGSAEAIRTPETWKSSRPGPQLAAERHRFPVFLRQRPESMYPNPGTAEQSPDFVARKARHPLTVIRTLAWNRKGRSWQRKLMTFTCWKRTRRLKV
jgi:hypothetical protein